MKVMTITIPMDLTRRGGRKKIIVPDGLPRYFSRPSGLSRTVLRRFRWLISHRSAEIAQTLFYSIMQTLLPTEPS